MEDRYYISRYNFNHQRSIVWKEIVKFESKFIPQKGVVVDLGAGYCDFINNVKSLKKYAVDISPELSKYAQNDVIKINSAAWKLSEIPDSSADVVHASNLIEHFTDEEIEKTMREIKRVLKNRGKLILMQPNYRFAYKNYFDDWTHKKIFTDISMEDFLNFHNMKIVFKMPKFLPLSFKSKKTAILNKIPNPLLSLLIKIYIYSPVKPFAGQMLFIAEKL